MIYLIADGACSGNPGPGGWAYRLKTSTYQLDGWGFSLHTTNNRMEQTAVIEAFLQIEQSSKVHVISDSLYVVNAFVQGWLSKWLELYKQKGVEPKKNFDLWLKLNQLVQKHDVTWEWTKGHAGHFDQTFCDEKARWAMLNQASGRFVTRFNN